MLPLQYNGGVKLIVFKRKHKIEVERRSEEAEKNQFYVFRALFDCRGGWLGESFT